MHVCVARQNSDNLNSVSIILDHRHVHATTPTYGNRTETRRTLRSIPNMGFIIGGESRGGERGGEADKEMGSRVEMGKAMYVGNDCICCSWVGGRNGRLGRTQYAQELIKIILGAPWIEHGTFR